MNPLNLNRGPVLHELKIHPEFFTAVRAGRKTAELRIDDRDFRIGDVLVLKEWKPQKKEFTGKELRRAITDITRLGNWINVPEVQDWVILHMGSGR